MWELTKRISLRISSVLSMVEPEPDLRNSSGSEKKVPVPAPQHCLKHNNSPQNIGDNLLPIIFNTKAEAEAAKERSKSLLLEFVTRA